MTLVVVGGCSGRHAPDHPSESPSVQVRQGFYYLPLNADEVGGELDTVLDTYRAGGVQGVVTGVYLPYTCRDDGAGCDLAAVDRLVDGARRRGMTVSLQIGGLPSSWRTRGAGGATVPEWALPRDDREMSRLAQETAAIARRYAGRVERLELWNEPNSDQFSPDGVSPQRYARTYAAAWRAVRAVPSRPLLCTGGVSRGDVGFVGSMLDSLRGLGVVPDEVGVHPYAGARPPWSRWQGAVRAGQWGPVDESALGWRSVVSALDARRMGDVKVWLGEFGYSTSATWMPPVPDTVRALFAAEWLTSVRGDQRVSGAAWYAGVPDSQTGVEWAVLRSSGGGDATATWKALAWAAHGERLSRLVVGKGCLAADVDDVVRCVDPHATQWALVRGDGRWETGSGRGPENMGDGDRLITGDGSDVHVVAVVGNGN